MSYEENMNQVIGKGYVFKDILFPGQYKQGFVVQISKVLFHTSFSQSASN